MENLSNAGSGIKKAYNATKGALICLLLMCASVLQLYAAFGILAFTVYHMIGLREAGKDLAGCKKAFVLSIVSLVLIILSISPYGYVRVPASLVRCGTEFLIVHLVFTSVSQVTDCIGTVDVRQEGKMAWQVNAVCYGLIAAATILDWMFIQMFCTIVIMLAALLAKVFYMLLLGKCNQALNHEHKE